MLETRTGSEPAAHGAGQSSWSASLVPLHATQSRESALVCLPGAGASVTAFIDFIGALGARWPVYGLQPRGVDGLEQPHDSVEAAALDGFAAIGRLGDVPVHLFGHSHGGRVAFEIALRLQQQGKPVRSLTLVDSEPPEIMPEHGSSESDFFTEFVRVFEKTFNVSLVVPAGIMSSGRQEVFLNSLHALLVAQGCLPARSVPSMLQGPLTSFIAARRSVYRPTARFDGRMRLVLVRDIDLALEDDLEQREDFARKWRSHATELEVWHGPGHHFSILQPPHVRALTEWWSQTVLF